MQVQKKPITVYINSDVLAQLREIVKTKYEGSWGLSWEVEEAIRAWLRLQHAQIHTKRLNPSKPLIHIVMDEIIQRLRNQGCFLQCTYKELQKAISEVRGSDERTYKKWLNILLQENRIKQIGTYTYEIV